MKQPMSTLKFNVGDIVEWFMPEADNYKKYRVIETRSDHQIRVIDISDPQEKIFKLSENWYGESCFHSSENCFRKIEVAAKFKVGDIVEWHIPEEDNHWKYHIVSVMGDRVKIRIEDERMPDADPHALTRLDYHESFFKKVGDKNMAKKCANCNCETTEVIDYVELTKKELVDAIQEAINDSGECAQEIIDDCYNNYPEVMTLIELLKTFGFVATIKDLGFEVILTKV